MPRNKESLYRLADAERRAAGSKDFKIPPREEREDLWPGDLAKLVFEDVGERLWVRVMNVMGEGLYVGAVESSPLYDDLHRGDEVIFESKNVAGITRNCVPGFDRPFRKQKQKTILQ